MVQLELNKMDQTISLEKIPLLSNQSKSRYGGLRTMPFIIVNESFEKLASYGLMPNMIFYLMNSYHMKTAAGSSILSLWSALSNFLAIFGAFLSDSYLGRFRVIVIGSFSSLLGMTLLWLTAMIPQLKPPPCDQFNTNCNFATPTQLAILFSSFGLMSIGAGCIRPCSIAFGADQFDNKQNPDNDQILHSFFNWYYASVGLSTVLALTLIVYIQDHMGWAVGFAVPAVLMVFSAFTFLLGSSLYVKVKATNSFFTGFIQVVVVAFKKRNINHPPSNFDQYYHSSCSEYLVPSDNLRWLNKACIINEAEVGLNTNEPNLSPWNLCTVEQVESLKALLRVIPIWSTGIIMMVSLNQSSFSTLQAKTMKRHITSNFEIPAASFTIIMVSTLTIWIAFYDRVLVPLLSKYTRNSHGLSAKLRIGIGLILSVLAMTIAGFIENVRRKRAIQQGVEEDPTVVVNMSALWLVPQFMVLGLAEAFNSVGQIEFFYSKFPKSMSSIGVALFTVGMAVASLVGSALINIVDGVTSNAGKSSWLASNINEGHLDYYYWLVAALGVINFVYFVVCCS